MSDLGYLLAFVGFALVPVAIGIAILRYRLYDIDILIRRTAVYVPLTAILAGLYAALTALLQRLFIAATGERSDAAVIASTLLLATLFTPVKGWLQGVVDRRFRDDADAGRQLERFISRIGTAEYAPDPGRTLRAFAAVAVNALDATGGRAVVANASGAPRGDAGPGWPTVLSVEVASAERVLGRIDVGPRSRQRAYRPDEQALLQVAADDLARAILVGDPGPSGTPAPDGRQAGHAKLVDETVEAPAATG